MTERIVESFKQLAKALLNLANQLSHTLITAIKPLLPYDPKKRRSKVSYNAKYWKITDNRSSDIDLMVQSFGSNEKCYYSKMDR